jgi:hypothetical protein
MNCSRCLLPAPADWCWHQHHDCPLGFPPRHVDPHVLLRLLVDLQRRVAALEASTRGSAR